MPIQYRASVPTTAYFSAVLAVSAFAGEPQTNRKSEPFLDSLPWGRICAVESTLILQIDKPVADGVLTMPRLNNPVKAIYFRGTPDNELQLIPHPREWKIALPPDRQDETGHAIVVQLEGTPYLPEKPRVVEPDEESQIRLAAHDVVTHGESLRYEPQPHKNTVGYWTNPKDWAQWHFTVDRPGMFSVGVRYGCGDGQGGSVVRLECADQHLQWTVEATGGFQKWREIRPGTIRLDKPGKYSMVLRTVTMSHAAVMDVQQIMLVPDG